MRRREPIHAPLITVEPRCRDANRLSQVLSLYTSDTTDLPKASTDRPIQCSDAACRFLAQLLAGLPATFGESPTLFGLRHLGIQPILTYRLNIGRVFCKQIHLPFWTPPDGSLTARAFSSASGRVQS